jgi:GT2 family glycosyltransferase
LTQSPVLITSIVAYKTPPSELASSIKSAHRTRHPHEVVVVDNSRDTALEPVVLAEGGVYRKASRNLGFGSAHNLILRDAIGRSPFCLVLNPDCSFEDGVLDELLEFLSKNDDAGLVMPRVVYPDGSEQRLSKLLPRPSDLLARRFGGRFLKSLQAEAMRRFECGRMDLSAPMNIPYLSGCFMLMRTAALERVGLFDERIFMYLEDLDLTRRLHREFSTVFYPYVSITHRHGRGSYSSGRLLRTHLRSALYYFSKYGWFFDPERRKINAEVEAQETGRWHRSFPGLPPGRS